MVHRSTSECRIGRRCCVPSRDAVVADLARTLARATVTDKDPAADLRRVATEYRAFVRANPNGYQLLFSALPAGASPDPATLASLGEPIVRAMAGLAGEPVALEGARTMVAWAHGFVSMELAGGFRLGGDLDAAYAFGIEAILAGRQRGGEPRVTLRTNRTTNSATTSASAPMSRGCAFCIVPPPPFDPTGSPPG